MSREILFALLVSCVGCYLSCAVDQSGKSTGPPGHLQPLGSHQAPEGDVEVLDYVPHPIEFFENYVQASKPVLMKGAAKGSRAFKMWNDKYLTEKFGHLIIMTEHGKKENRSWGTSHIQLKTFLKRYNQSDEYLVETLPPPMREDYQLPRSLLCGGFTNFLRDAVVWFSSGGTKSVFHYDNVDNVNCLMSGSKDLFLADKKYHKLAHMMADGAYSAVDVDSVNVTQFPGLGKIPWWRARMEAGDCFYIPYKWFHQIRSYDRNLAINVWWVPLPTFQTADCYQDGDVDKERKSLDDYSSLSNFGFAPGETGRFDMMEMLKSNPDGLLRKKDLLEFLESTITSEDEDVAEAAYKTKRKAVKELLSIGDRNKDGALDAKELSEVPGKLIVNVFGMDTEEGQNSDDKTTVRDDYASEHPEVEADDLHDAEVDLPEGFSFPDDFDPETYDMSEYHKAVEAEKAKKAKQEQEEEAHTEL